MKHVSQPIATSSNQWLQTYYFLRAAVSIGWIVLAVGIGRSVPVIGAALLLAYPAWDAFANLLDARKSGGLRLNPTQMLNLIVSILTTAAVAIALGISMQAVIVVFGAWAILSGLLQLATAVRRWKSAGAQWVMVLSGGQSALAGLFFFKMAVDAARLDITAVAPYAALGAFYFLVSAIWLTVKNGRQSSMVAAAR